MEINGYRNDEIGGEHDVPETYEEQRALLLAIEQRIKEICADVLPTDRVLAAGMKTLSERGELDQLLQWRQAVLNGMWHEGNDDDDLEQCVFNQVRNYLYEMEGKVVEECCRLNKLMAGHSTDEDSPFTGTWIEGIVSYLPPTHMPDSQYFDRCSLVEHDFDDYYGSDFPYMLSLIALVELEPDFAPRLHYMSAAINPSEEEFIKELAGNDCHSAFDGLRLHFADVDIMHLNRFKAEVNVRVMGATDARGNIDYETYIPAAEEYLDEEAEAFDYHKHTTHNRAEIEASTRCACVACCATFPAAEVTDYTDNGTTALCPRCGIDAVIGDASDADLDEPFLRALHRKWF